LQGRLGSLLIFLNPGTGLLNLGVSLAAGLRHRVSA
jgi:hypothetical protein